ncbi:hypothetical protein BCY91_12280 [Pelobium manganitolerans]|uniref:Methyltransferase FkbM domain-containing protein n=2 Tax=Pelobium manganitolerans TaxID=1842495 RepID=A0A419S206_9SPHI|nr:hypothetical protein BCY91_12280 [Pelobium manganitolerans]
MLEALKRTFTFIHQHPFANRHLFRAYTKFFKWQFQSVFNKKFIVKPFVGDVRFWAKKGLTGITGNIYCGLHEFEDMGFLLHFLRPEDAFYDIGANVGSYTLLASGVVGCETLAFEPSQISYDVLKKNIALNQIELRVKAYNFALGAKTGFLNFTEYEGTSNRVVAANADIPFKKVEVKKLDDFAEASPRFLKIDVEGFETAVLDGASEMLKKENLKAIAIELNGSGNRYGFNEQDIHAGLTALGFKPYKYEPYSRTLHLLPIFTEYDTLYIRDLPFVNDRLKTAKAFKLWNQYI